MLGSDVIDVSVCLTDFSVLALLFNSSRVMSCKTGSTSSSSASRFLSSLWRWMTNPPRLYIIAWSTWKMSPRRQTEGVSGTSQSYLSFTASRNSLSFKSKSLSVIGKTVSQLNAPFWVAIKSHSSYNFLQKSSFSPYQAFPSDTDSSLGACLFVQCVLHCHPAVHVSAILFVELTDQRVVDATYSKAAAWLGFVNPMPLILTGNASSSRSACIQLCPVMENMRVSAIARSRGASRSSVSDRVLRKYSRCPALF